MVARGAGGFSEPEDRLVGIGRRDEPVLLSIGDADLVGSHVRYGEYGKALLSHGNHGQLVLKRPCPSAPSSDKAATVVLESVMQLKRDDGFII